MHFSRFYHLNVKLNVNPYNQTVQNYFKISLSLHVLFASQVKTKLHAVMRTFRHKGDGPTFRIKNIPFIQEKQITYTGLYI